MTARRTLVRIGPVLCAFCLCLGELGCESEDYTPERDDWIVVENVSGRWIGKVYGPPATQTCEYDLRQSGTTVDGTWTVFNDKGAQLQQNHVSGEYDRTTGVLTLQNPGCYGGGATITFKFTSETEMYDTYGNTYGIAYMKL